MIRFLDLAKQYELLKSDIDKAIAAVIADTAFIGGKYATDFEEKFSEYQQVENCVAVANGTDALEIAIESLALPRDSEVIVPANSFIASSEAVTRSGCKVVFADIDARSYLLDTNDLVRRITRNTSAIIAVHLYGQPARMDALMEIANKHNLRVIEDCAQAHGAEFKGRRVGSFGDIGTFSFYPGKNLGAYGDAGAIVTKHEEIARYARMLANHGRAAKYDHEFEGRNSRMDGIQAAVLSVKLGYLDNWIELRNAIANEYSEKLGGISEVLTPFVWDDVRHVFHLYVIQVAARDQLKSYLDQLEIQTGIHYPIALPKLKAYDYLGQASEEMAAINLGEKLLSLPIGDHMDRKQAATVVQSVFDFFEKNKVEELAATAR